MWWPLHNPATGRPKSHPKKMKTSASKTNHTIQLVRNGKEYVFQNGLRHVIPYWLDFSTGCRDRWVGQKVFDIYRKEFPYFSEAYLKKAFELGRLKQGNQYIHDVETMMDKNKTITHSVHFHEKPIFDRDIQILHDEPDLLVVDKPPSFPVHPCGRYKKNSLTYILEENGYENLHAVHRLDHSTSGVLLIGRTKEAAQKIMNIIKTKDTIGKYYLAITSGNWLGTECDSGYLKENFTQCDSRVYCENHKKGIWRADDEKGTQEALTFFSGIAYNKEKNISLVMCKPITGRTHQIRIHLEKLGKPIENDFFYNAEFVKQLERGEIAQPILESVGTTIQQTLAETSSNQVTNKQDDKLPTPADQTDTDSDPPKKKKKNAPGKLNTNPKQVQLYEHVCINCNADYQDDTVHSNEDETTPMCIYLHSWRYELSETWTFQTAIPEWVITNFPFLSQTELEDFLHTTRKYLLSQSKQDKP